MKKAIYYIIGACLALTACDFEVSDNGKLDGFWQLKSVDTLATGRSADLRAQELSWSFQGKALELRNAKDFYADVLMSFSRTGDVLQVSNPIFILRVVGDSVVTDVEPLRQFGVNSLDERFRIVGLDGSSMTLQSEQLQLNFRKY